MTDHYYTENPHSKIERKQISYTFHHKTYHFTTSTGVFSKERIDFGSRVLIEAFRLPSIDGDILDLGCGYGPVGILLGSRWPNRQFVMVDINERALSLARENAAANGVNNVEVVKSDGLEALEQRTFAAILTNPPIRQGKKMIYAFFEQARKALADGGELWIVMQKKQGAPSAVDYLRTLFEDVQIVQREKGYYVIVAKSLT